MAIDQLETIGYLNSDTTCIFAILVGGLEHGFYFSIYCEFHHPN